VGDVSERSPGSLNTCAHSIEDAKNAEVYLGYGIFV